MRVSTQIVAVAVLAGLAAGAWYARDRLPWSEAPARDAQGMSAQDKGGSGRRPTLVEAMPARQGDVTVAIEAVGTARANEAVTVASKVTGLVSAIRFREGGRVERGDVLVELDSREMRAVLEERKAERDNAARLYERARRLYENRNAPRARVDDLHDALLSAEARFRAEEARIGDYDIRAPFGGRLGLRRVSVGALIDPDTEITTLDDVSRIKADFRVPETALAHIAVGQGVTVASAVFAGRVFVGKVAAVDTRVDPVTRSVEVRVVFDNPDELVRPGMFLTAEFVTVVRKGSVLIPEQAVVVGRNRRHVFIVEHGKAARRDVTTGEHVDGDIEVLAGLSPGDVVVTAGMQKIRDDAPVTVTPPPGEAGGDAGRPLR